MSNAHGIPTSGPRLQKWLKNPGLRSKLKDSSLPADLLAKRRANRSAAIRNATLLNPLATLAGRPLLDAANAEVALQYDPQQHQLDQQRSDILAQNKSVGDYASNQYALAASRAKDILGSLAGLATDASTQTQATSGGAQARTEALRAAAAQASAHDASVRGAGLGGTNNQAQQLQAIDAANAADAATATGATNSANAAYDALARETLAAYQQQGGEFQHDLANTAARSLQANDAAQRDLTGQRTAARIKALTDLRQNQFDNYATGQTLGLKQDQLKQDLTLAQMRDRTTRRGQDIANANADATRQVAIGRLAAYRKQINWAHQDRLAALAAKGSKNGKGTSGLTPKQLADLHRSNEAIRGTIQTASTLFPSLIGKPRDPNDPSKGKVSQDEAIAGIATKYFHGDRALAQAAYDYYKYKGRLLVEDAQALKRHGIGVPHDWRPGSNIPASKI